jgi:hypothetical protein
MAPTLPSAIRAMDMFQICHICCWREVMTSFDYTIPKYLTISSFMFKNIMFHYVSCFPYFFTFADYRHSLVAILQMVILNHSSTSDISPPGSYLTYTTLILTILRYSRFELWLTLNIFETIVHSPHSYSLLIVFCNHPVGKAYRTGLYSVQGRLSMTLLT